MADIRINALPTTASASSSDDYIALDGTTNGTRKLNAYSPTFGGNLTVSGTGGVQLNSVANLTWGGSYGAGIPTIAIPSATSIGFYPTGSTSGKTFELFGTGNATLTGNLTVSGGTITGGTSGMSLASGGTNQSITLTPSGTGRSNAYGSIPSSAWAANDLDSSFNAGLVVGPRGTGSSFGVSTASASSPYPSGLLVDGSYAAPNSTVNIKAVGVYSGGGYGASLAFHTSSNTTLSEVGRFTKAGNLLLGTTTDSGNGKLQLATHTTSAGGIGFGTDTALYRQSAGNLTLSTSTAGAGFSVTNSTNGGQITAQSAGTPMFVLSDTTQALNEKIWGIRSSSASFVIGAWTDSYSGINNAIKIDRSAATPSLVTITPNLTVSGAIAIGNTVQTAASVASTHKVTVVIGGVTYYLLATNV